VIILISLLNVQHKQEFAMKKSIIRTSAAPAAIGTYSQAVKVDNTVYLSGQIPLDPASGEMVAGEIRVQITRVFDSLLAVAKAAGGSLQDVVKLNVFLTDLKNFPQVNEIMAQYFKEPYPARAAVGVAALPRAAQVEMDAVMVLDETRAKRTGKKKAKKKAKRRRR
jgi:reactive intermediate/imine deaminase